MRSSKIIFFDPKTKLSVTEKVIIILSPAFYWFHKERLDISPSQAKKIAPSIFEGVIPKGEYSYYVEKVGQEYHFYAYEEKKIIEALQKSGIKPSYIQKILAAQMVFSHIKEPVTIGDKTLLCEEGVVTVLPKKVLALETKNYDLQNLSLPKKSLPVRLRSFAKISQEDLFKLSIATLVALVLYGAQAYLHKRELNELNNKERAIKERYHLPPTSIQLQSILHSLQKINKKELAIRETVAYILKTPLRPSEYIDKLHVGKKVHIEFSLSAPARASTIKSYLSKRLHLNDVSLEGNRLAVEASL